MKKIILSILTLGLAFSMVGCEKEPEVVVVPQVEKSEIEVEEEAAEEVEVEEVEEEVAVPVPEGMYRSELTNEIISKDIENQRPIAAMVDNDARALPHYGLTDADIIYELMNSTANGRITRFMVVVKDWDKIEQLGSIRSVRPTNIMLASEYNAVLCHDGGPFYINDWIAKPYIDNFSGTFARISNGKPREFTEYIATGDVEKNFKNHSLSTEYNEYYKGAHFKFADENNEIVFDEADSQPATSVKLPFKNNQSYLEYDEETGLYMYGEHGGPHLDAGNDNKQLAFKNVLIQECTFSQLDENGYMIFNAISNSSLDGYYLTNGRAIPVTWNKIADDALSGEHAITTFYDSDGNEITVNTGKSYIALVPDDDWSNLSIK